MEDLKKKLDELSVSELKDNLTQMLNNNKRSAIDVALNKIVSQNAGLYHGVPHGYLKVEDLITDAKRIEAYLNGDE